MAQEAEPREWLLHVVGRPLLVVFWALILWGTLYGAVFLHSAFEEGLTPALLRTLSGRDAAAGVINLALAALAPVVWCLVIIALWQNRLDAARKRGRGRGV
jgi:hypothetical protein